MTLLVDVNEPVDQFAKYVNVSCPYETSNLNTNGFADYLWHGANESITHVERKQWGEVLANIDHVEDQLRRHLVKQQGSKLVFLIEGVVCASGDKSVVMRQYENNGKLLFTSGHDYSIRVSQLYSWLHQIQNYIQVIQTASYLESTIALVAMYRGDQKKEHQTFTRAYKEVVYHYDPRVTSLMGLMPGIGEKKAENLINKFITVWNVLNATPKELESVDGIGPVLAKKILRQIGRPDV